ncbi:MAG: hypothetical protein RDV41_01510 [Planctomycetota bacterium]|nr:hypothetical protein [Planctomycetota bacterium]
MSFAETIARPGRNFSFLSAARRSLLLILVLAACLCGCARAGGAPTPPDGGTNPPPIPVPVPTPPQLQVNNVIREAHYDIAESGNRLRVNLRLKVSVLETADPKSWSSMPLLPPDIAVVDCDLREGDGFVRRDTRGTAAFFQRQGDFSFTISFLLTPHKVGDETSIEVPMVSAEISRIALALQQKKIEFAVPEDAILETAEEDDKTTRAGIVPGKGDKVAVSWFPKGTRRPVGYSLSSEEVSSFRFADGAVRIETLITSTVGRGGVSALTLAIPADRTILKVASDGLRDWRTEDTETGKVIKLVYGERCSGEIKIAVLQEIRTDFLPALVSLMPLTVVEADRQSGIIALLVPATMQLREQERDGAARIDDAELLKRAPWLQGQVTMAYQYPRPQYKLAVQAEKVMPKISAQLDTLFRLERGIVQVAVAAAYTVEDAGTYEFSFACPPEFSLSEIVGRGIRDWKLADGVLTVMLKEQVVGKYGLSFSGQVPMKKINGIELLLFHTRNTYKQNGSIGVAVEPDVDLTPRSSEDMIQVDPNELPPWMLGCEGPGRAFAPDSKEAQDWRRQNDELAKQGQQKSQSLLQEEATPIETRAREVKLGFKFIGHKGKMAVSVAEVKPEVAVVHSTLLTVFDSRYVLDAVLQLDVRKRGIFELVATLPDGFVPTVVGGPVAEWSVVSEEAGRRRIRMKFDGEKLGQFMVEIVAERIAGESDAESLALKGITVAGAYREEGTFVVNRASDIEARFAELSGAEETDPKLCQVMVAPKAAVPATPEEGILALRFRSASWQTALRVTKLKPQVDADIFYFLRVREGEMAADALVTYNIQRAGVGRFVVRLPKGAVNSRVVGEDVRTAHLEEDVWTITLEGRKRGTYQLYFQFNQRAERAAAGTRDAEKPAAGKVDFKGLTLDGVENEKGTIIVAAGTGNTRVTVLDRKNVETLGHPATLPKDMTPYRRLGRLEEFGFTGKERSVTIEVAEMAKAQVETAKVESCELHTVLRESGEAVTYFGCLIENFNRQYLKARLGKDAVLWTAYVSGNPVKPSVDVDGTLLIPILGTDKSLNIFSLELVWVESRKGIGAFGGMDFETPWLDAGVNELTWQVYVPGNLDVISESGTMARDESAPVAEPAAIFPVVLRHLERLLEKAWDVVGPVLVVVVLVLIALAVIAMVSTAIARSRSMTRHAKIAVAAVSVLVVVVGAAVIIPSQLGSRPKYEDTIAYAPGYEYDQRRTEGMPGDMPYLYGGEPPALRTQMGPAPASDPAGADNAWVSEAQYEQRLQQEELAQVPQQQALNVGKKAAELQERAAGRQRAIANAREAKAKEAYRDELADVRLETEDRKDIADVKIAEDEEAANENWESQSDAAFQNMALRTADKKLQQEGKRDPALGEAAGKFAKLPGETEDMPHAGAEPDRNDLDTTGQIPGDLSRPLETTLEPGGRPATSTPAPQPPQDNAAGLEYDASLALATTDNFMLRDVNAKALAATGSSGYVRAKGGQAAGALPIQISIPTTQTAPRVFKQSFAGTSQGKVEMSVVDRSASMILQTIIALVIGVLVVVAARKRFRETLPAAIVIAFVLFALASKPATVWQAYVSTAAGALVLGAIVAIAAWLCRRAGSASRPVK